MLEQQTLSQDSSQSTTPTVQQQTEHSTTSTSAVEVIPVAPAEMEQFWGVLEPLMIKVIDGMHGRHSMATLLQDIVQGSIQLWAVVINREIKAVVGTHLRDYPTGVRTCCIDFAGGAGFRHWVEQVIEAVEDYARVNYCDRVETFARKGWAKLLNEYKLTHVHLERELD